MKIKVTKFPYGLELVLKTNSTENWYGWTKECCLSLHDSGPSQLAWCKPDNQHLQSAETEGNIPLVTRSQDINKMKGEVERSILSPQNGFFLFFFFLFCLWNIYCSYTHESISDLSISFHWYILPIFISVAELKNNNNCSFGIRLDIIIPCLNVHNTSLFLFLEFSYSRFLLHIVWF